MTLLASCPCSLMTSLCPHILCCAAGMVVVHGTSVQENAEPGLVAGKRDPVSRFGSRGAPRMLLCE